MQIWMNVIWIQTTAVLMPHAPIFLEAMSVPVTLGSLGMESAVMVRRMTPYIHV